MAFLVMVKVELRGYTNDSTQALGAVTEAAVRAAIQGPNECGT